MTTSEPDSRTGVTFKDFPGQGISSTRGTLFHMHTYMSTISSCYPRIRQHILKEKHKKCNCYD